MKAKELKAMSKTELEAKVAELKAELFNLRFQLAIGQLQNTTVIANTKRGGQVWIKIFPDKPVTEKPAETRMGSGKGSPEYWVAVVKPGRVLFEIKGVTEDVAREALRLASHKLPLKTKFLKREEKKEAGGEA